MFYLFSRSTYHGTEYVQVEIRDDIVTACKGWYYDVSKCLKGGFISDVRLHYWSRLPQLLTKYVLLATSDLPITADTHPELLI